MNNPRKVPTGTFGPSGLRWSPDGRRLAYARFSGGTYLIDADGSNRRLLHAETMGAAWSPTDVRRLVLNVKGALYRVDPDTGGATFLAGGSAHGRLRDGSRLVTSSRQGTGLTDWNGCVQPLFTGEMVVLTTWSPDSTRVILFRTWPYQSQ